MDGTEPDRADLVVMVGTGFARLQQHGTRWRALLERWSRDPRVGRLTVVDYPGLSPRHLARRRLVQEQRSWLPGARLLRVAVPVFPRTTPFDNLAWRRTGAALRRTLGAPQGRRIAVAATPLWVPVLQHLGATRTAFDAVDDWRSLPAVQRVRSHVEAGYRALPGVDVVTAVSQPLADRLERDFGVPVNCLGNGVDLRAFRQSADLELDGLPDAPFAVYVGVVQERVDIDLLEAVAAHVPVVVAGPATGEAARRLESSPLQWIGAIDVGQVPSLLQRAAVGLVPHRVDALTTSMDPMKLLEYLAAGLPVVSTPLPGMSLSPRVRTAEGPAPFAAAVLAALEDGVMGVPDAAVLHRDWDVVSARLLGMYLL